MIGIMKFPMSKINVVITGQLKNKKNLIKTINNFYKADFINQIIISTWTEEVNKNKTLFFLFKKRNIELVSEKSPNFKVPFFFQSKSLENGLKYISNRELPVFKTRTDLFIDKKYVFKIINQDFTLNNKSVFNKRVWIPFFEISKPFYFGDECFYGEYKDLNKLINYEEKYDFWKIGPGSSHVRRFCNPYIEQFKKIESVQKLNSITNHGGPRRFETLTKLLKNEAYLEYLFFNFLILSNEFRIGLQNTKSYINFREWSSGVYQPKVQNFYSSFAEENSFNPQLGQIFSYDEMWLENIINNSEIINLLKNNILYSEYLNSFNK